MTPKERGKLAIREDVRLSSDLRDPSEAAVEGSMEGGEVERDEKESIKVGGATTVLAASLPMSWFTGP